MIIINFFKRFRSLLGSKQLKIHANEITVLELLRQCEIQTSKSFLKLIITPEGKLLPGILILVNGQNVLNLQGVYTIVRNGANVAIFHPD
jgi:molybdopterin synthase sulfur carrier subunit